MSASTQEQQGVGRGAWMALTAALLGWLFDGFEMGLFPMVARPALKELLPDASEADIGFWFGVVTSVFLVGAATGGVLFGWLGDRIGRVRAMALSVLTYAVFTGLCGVAGSGEQMGILRFIASLGMGGEWSLGVALVMEVWPNKSRAFMAGLIGAAANVGYLLVGVVGIGLATILKDLEIGLTDLGMAQEWVDKLVRNQGWRIMMMMGAAPALLTFLIRLFVPESKRWEQEKASGATSNWATRDLLGVLVGALGPVLIIYLWAVDHAMPIRILGSLLGLALATGGYTYPVIRYLQRLTSGDHVDARPWKPILGRMLLAAGISGVALLGTWGAAQWAPTWAAKLEPNSRLHPKEWTQIAAAVGAIIGTIAAALVGDWLGRRITYSLLCVLSLISLLVLYQGNTAYGPMFLASTFLVGVCTASFYGWLPLYLPELFHTNIRATGQGFGFNFGRIIAAVGALQTGSLFAEQIHLFGRTFKGGHPFACSAMSAIYLVGLGLIWLAPETKGKPLPD
jgi:SHS family sialic acid transporter-like MFS transporter